MRCWLRGRGGFAASSAQVLDVEDDEYEGGGSSDAEGHGHEDEELLLRREVIVGRVVVDLLRDAPCPVQPLRPSLLHHHLGTGARLQDGGSGGCGGDDGWCEMAGVNDCGGNVHHAHNTLT